MATDHERAWHGPAPRALAALATRAWPPGRAPERDHAQRASRPGQMDQLSDPTTTRAWLTQTRQPRDLIHRPSVDQRCILVRCAVGGHVGAMGRSWAGRPSRRLWPPSARVGAARAHGNKALALH